MCQQRGNENIKNSAVCFLWEKDLLKALKGVLFACSVCFPGFTFKTNNLALPIMMA